MALETSPPHTGDIGDYEPEPEPDPDRYYEEKMAEKRLEAER